MDEMVGNEAGGCLTPKVCRGRGEMGIEEVGRHWLHALVRPPRLFY